MGRFPDGMKAGTNPILIAGTGAMACLFGARLAAGGVPVVLMGAWTEALAALSRRGVGLVDQDGQVEFLPVGVVDSQLSAYEIKADYALILVKSWQTSRVAGQLVNFLAPAGLALTLQNGLGNREKLAEVLGEDRVALGVTTIGATLLEPGKVRLGGEGKISLTSNTRLDGFTRMLDRAGFTIERVVEPETLLWGKLVINASINPLTALLQAPNGALLENPTALEVLRAVARETAGVAQALGISLPYADPAAAAEGVARLTASNRSSMLQDVQRNAPTEIDAICGAIVATGGQMGVPTPFNWMLWKLIQALVFNKSVLP